MNRIKPLSELEFKDDYMFTAIMENEEICREILEIILEVKIKKIIYLETEKTIKTGYTNKSIRLDVFVNDEKGTVYNVEMQNGKITVLPRRSRYYQANMDTSMLIKGTNYDALPDSFVIFICTEDPFSEGLYKYTFRYVSDEKNDLLLNDGTTKIFLNTKGQRGNVSPRLKALLDYLESPERKPSDPVLMRIEQERIKISADQVRRLDYMKYEADMQDNYREGKLDGESIGLKKGETIGLKKGETIGLKKGETIGLKKGEKSIIMKLLETMDIDNVAEATGKTVKEIKELLNANN